MRPGSVRSHVSPAPQSMVPRSATIVTVNPLGPQLQSGRNVCVQTSLGRRFLATQIEYDQYWAQRLPKRGDLLPAIPLLDVARNDYDNTVSNLKLLRKRRQPTLWSVPLEVYLMALLPDYFLVGTYHKGGVGFEPMPVDTSIIPDNFFASCLLVRRCEIFPLDAHRGCSWQCDKKNGVWFERHQIGHVFDGRWRAYNKSIDAHCKPHMLLEYVSGSVPHRGNGGHAHHILATAALEILLSCCIQRWY